MSILNEMVMRMDIVEFVLFMATLSFLLAIAYIIIKNKRVQHGYYGDEDHKQRDVLVS